MIPPHEDDFPFEAGRASAGRNRPTPGRPEGQVEPVPSVDTRAAGNTEQPSPILLHRDFRPATEKLPQAGAQGDPASSSSSVPKKTTWAIRVTPWSTQAAVVLLVGPGRVRNWSMVRNDDAQSVPETVLRAYSDGLRLLADLGATDVVLVVLDRTLDGYLRLGWRPRSLAMLRALRGLVQALEPFEVRWSYR